MKKLIFTLLLVSVNLYAADKAERYELSGQTECVDLSIQHAGSAEEDKSFAQNALILNEDGSYQFTGRYFSDSECENLKLTKIYKGTYSFTVNPISQKKLIIFEAQSLQIDDKPAGPSSKRLEIFFDNHVGRKKFRVGHSLYKKN